MRSTTFDMVAMMLMAIMVIITTGGILTWSYCNQPGGPDKSTADRSENVSEPRNEGARVQR